MMCKDTTLLAHKHKSSHVLSLKPKDIETAVSVFVSVSFIICVCERTSRVVSHQKTANWTRFTFAAEDKASHYSFCAQRNVKVLCVNNKQKYRFFVTRHMLIMCSTEHKSVTVRELVYCWAVWLKSLWNQSWLFLFFYGILQYLLL